MQLSRPSLGFALMEALVALMILTIGLLGLLWMHQQALLQQRQQLMRAIATGLADDLAERMRLNTSQASRYAKVWGTSPSTSVDCIASPCSPQDLATWDLQSLQQNLQHQLPEGDVAIFALSQVTGWWGVVVAWPDASENYRTDTVAGSPPCPAHMSCWRLFFRPDR
jgi:type IV pilus assembly protein PilV